MSKIWLYGLAFVVGLPGVSHAASPTEAKRRPTAAGTSVPVAASPARAAPAPAPKGYRVAPPPAWVVEPPAAPAPSATSASSRRDQLVDMQMNYALPKATMFLRTRSVAFEASALGAVSQPQIRFNPAFQSVLLHSAQVVRDGKRLDRLKDARVELMRRETQLERQVIDGTETLLLVLADVRVGETVEVAYSVEGSNPIFEGRISDTFQTAFDTPVDLLHQRIVAPADRNLSWRTIAGEAAPERSTDGPRQVLRVVRTQIAPVVSEQATPPWFKVYPAWHLSEFAQWSEVDAWAQRLFGPAQKAGAGVRARADTWRAAGLSGDALLAEALRFVQDEVRYFSVSLGESSHRPKPAEQTLTELLGDCKDKVVLLNALLIELGFDAKPALVSFARNRGLVNYLPSHDQFDHVISRVDHNGRVWFLDATMTGQGLTLAERGQYPYGQALVVGGNGALTAVAESADAPNQVDYEQRWDFTKPGASVKFDVTMRLRGLAAEQWRAGIAAVGLQRITEPLAGAHVRVFPGLRPVGEATAQDDRKTNVMTVLMKFEHPNLGEYNRGAIDAEVGAVELLDVLTGPPEANRRMPFMLDSPRVTTSRIEVVTPLPNKNTGTPPSQEVADPHFRLSSRIEQTPHGVVFVRRLERRTDEVQPADVASFRESVLKARQQIANRIRVPLVEPQSMRPSFDQLDRRLLSEFGSRSDQLMRIIVRNHVEQMLASEALRTVQEGTPLAARVLAARATAANLLGDFAASLPDADAALAVDGSLDEALEARGVALVGLGRMDEAYDAFAKLDRGDKRTMARKWQASVDVQRGRHAQAEALLRDVIAQGGGDDRDFALLWLYIAAEHQGGRGKAAIAPYVDAADSKRFVGALLHFLDGRLDRDALIRRAREDTEMERLNLAEAYFFIAQQLAAQGQRDEARRWFARTVDTKALPYREVTFAKLELARRATP
jgi:lipoprotein NlpI